MITNYLLFALLVIFGVFIIYLGDRLMAKKSRIKTLEKQRSNKMTDFEKLSFIISIYKQVDIENLREDQKLLWNEWVESITLS